jgi:glycerate kinase
MTPNTDPPAPPPAAAPPVWRSARGVGISQRVLIACAAFGPGLSARAVASAIAEGVEDGSLLEPDLCALPELNAGALPDLDIGALPIPSNDAEAVRRLLEELDFDTRMRSARAVIVGAERLEERTLAGSVTFEIATRARQSGVPAYAVIRENTLDAFDARVLDLQLILQARSRKALVCAGRELARLV